MEYAKVSVWMPTSGKNYTLGNGHAGLKVKCRNGEKYYITWLQSKGGCGRTFVSQGTEANRQLGFETIQNRKTGKVEENPYRLGSGQEFTYKRDEYGNGGHPNFSYELPVQSDDASESNHNYFGVSPTRMARFWKHLLSLDPSHTRRRYGLLSTRQNCNGMVVDALLAGGLANYVSPPNNVLFQDARTLVKWVEQAEAKIKEMNRQRGEVLRLLRENHVQLPLNQRAVPTPDQWKADSDKGIFFLARRKEQIEQLDMLIRLYHMAKAQKKRNLQLRLLFEMQWEIYSHLSGKPKSDRRQAVLTLACKVECVMADLVKEQVEAQNVSDWSDDSGSDREQIFF